MTSKISFFKLVRQEISRLGWLFALQILVFWMLIPFRLLIMLTNRLDDLNMDRLDIFCQNMGFGQWENTFVILCFGIICALCGFAYLHSQVKLDFYYSLALKRERLFAVKLVSSSLTFLIAYGSAQLLGAVIGLGFGAVSLKALGEVLAASLVGCLYFLCSYSGALLAVMLTGKMLTSILAIGVFGLYVPMVKGLLGMVQEIFMPTALFASAWGNSMQDFLKSTSPWAMCLFEQGSGEFGVTGMQPDAVSLVAIAGVTLVFMLVSLGLSRIRRTEAAGSAIAFLKLEPWIKLFLTVPMTFLAAMLCHLVFENMVWELVFLLVFGVLGCMIMEFFYRWDIQQVVKNKIHMLLTVGIAALLFFGARFDWIGYNTYLPDPEEIQSMAVLDYMNIVYEETAGGEKNSSDSYNFYTDEARILDHLEMEDFSLIYRIAQDGVQHVKSWISLPDTTVVKIKYHLKNGREVYRSYFADTELFMDAMEELHKKPEYRKLRYPILSWTEEEASHYCCSVYPSEYLFPTIPEEKRDQIYLYEEDVEKIVKAYQKDLETVSYRELYAGPTLEFYRVEKENIFPTSNYPVSAEMKRTVKALQEAVKDKN